MTDRESSAIINCRVKEQTRNESLDGITLDSYSQSLNCWIKLPESSELNVGLSRTHHTAVAWKDSIYIFGGCFSNDSTSELAGNGNGLNDMISFNITERVWKVVNPQTRPPAPRYNHTAVVYENSMMIFGGFSNKSNKNDVHQFRFDRQVWTPWVHISGEQPNPRSANCAFVYDAHMWIFGGYDGRNKLNDMWMLALDDDNPTWKKVEQHGQIHPPVLHAVCAVIDDKLYTFSGLCGVSTSNDILSFNLTTKTWSIVLPDLINNCCAAPDRRRGHTMVSHGKCLYIFGGQNTNSRSPNDLFCFDTEASAWHIVKSRNKPSKQVPSNRSYHAATIIDNIMFISGGVITGNKDKSDRGSDNFYCFIFASFPKSTLREDLSGLLDSRMLCDLEFVVGEGPEKESLFAHISIVAARSPILRMKIMDQLNELCDSKNHQNRDHILSVLDLDNGERVVLPFPKVMPAAFKIVLTFIYTDRIPHSVREDDNSIVTLTDVYGIANYFQLSRLEKICITYIQSYISIENALSALKVAKDRNLTELVGVLESFIIRDQNFKAIISREEFELLEKSSIIELIRLKTSTVTAIRSPHISSDTGQQSLEEDLQALLKDQKLSDITLTLTKDGIARRAHRAILIARCTYFRGMYRSLPPPQDTVGIKIGELEPTPDAFNSLMNYIYYNDTEIPPEDSLYLFTADKFYGFSNNQLQAYCKKSLETNIKTSNVIEILKAADQVHSEDMKCHALKMIAEHFTIVQPLPAFRTLEKSLLLEVTDYVATHMKGNRITPHTTPKHGKA